MQYASHALSIVIFLGLFFLHTTHTADTDVLSCNIKEIDPQFMALLIKDISTIQSCFPTTYTKLSGLSNQEGSLYLNSFVIDNGTKKPICFFFLEKAVSQLKQHAQKTCEQYYLSETTELYNNIQFMAQLMFNIDTHNTATPEPRCFFIGEKKPPRPVVNITPELYDNLLSHITDARKFTVKSVILLSNRHNIQCAYDHAIQDIEATIRETYRLQNLQLIDPRSIQRCSTDV
jgi:hypothetical protein